MVMFPESSHLCPLTPLFSSIKQHNTCPQSVLNWCDCLVRKGKVHFAALFCAATSILSPWCGTIERPAVMLQPQSQLGHISLQTLSPRIDEASRMQESPCAWMHVKRDRIPIQSDYSVISKKPKYSQEFCNFLSLKNKFEYHVIVWIYMFTPLNHVLSWARLPCMSSYSQHKA